MTNITISTLTAMKKRGEKIAMLTVYDAAFAHVLSTAGVDVLLVGDSLGMVCQGHTTTIPVTMENMVYHTRCVAKGNLAAFLLSDMPYQSCADPQLALANAAALMQAGAMMVKIEGGAWCVPVVRYLTERGIPVCLHLGLTPQSVHQLGGFKVQGRAQSTADQLYRDALASVEAGAQMLLLECVPQALAAQVTAAVDVPVIGIGAGPGCDGQVLVLHDMLGLTDGASFTFVKNFMTGAGSIAEAIRLYVDDVKSCCFPTMEHSFV